MKAHSRLKHPRQTKCNTALLVLFLCHQTHRSHRKNNALPLLMCRQRWRPRGCRCGAAGVRRQTETLREWRGSESGRRPDPAGGPAGCRHQGRVKTQYSIPGSSAVRPSATRVFLSRSFNELVFYDKIPPRPARE